MENNDNNENIFTIESEILDKLQEKFIQASELIASAIKEKRPVWIRHHNDCDGYSAALALEKVILKKLYNFHARESDVFYYYRRLPSRTPFYDYMDATKDLSSILDTKARFGRKLPLIIVVDNGSSDEDTLALRKLKVYDMPIIVIDHHPYSEENDKLLDVHINPLHVDDGYRFGAGMLCCELAELFAKKEMIETSDFNLDLIAATSGIADKIDGPELEAYLARAKEKGFEYDRLHDISEMISFELDYLSFFEAREFVENLFFGDIDKMNQFVDIVRPEIEKQIAQIRVIVEKNVEVVKMQGKDFKIGMIDTETTVNGHELSRSRITGHALKYLEEKESSPVVMLGYASDALSFRISKSLDFDMNDIRRKLQEKMPYAVVTGGGHPRAGSLRYAPKFHKEIMDFVKSYFN